MEEPSRLYDPGRPVGQFPLVPPPPPPEKGNVAGGGAEAQVASLARTLSAEGGATQGRLTPLAVDGEIGDRNWPAIYQGLAAITTPQPEPRWFSGPIHWGNFYEQRAGGATCIRFIPPAHLGKSGLK